MMYFDKGNLCFEDYLGPQHATFFPSITFDNNPVIFIIHRCLYKNMQYQSQCNVAGRVGRIYTFCFGFFYDNLLVLVKVIAISKSKIFTVVYSLT